jgi:hypothetical protein
MKTFIVSIEITGLTGTDERDLEIKARTEASARNKAWDIIGNRSGQIIDASEAYSVVEIWKGERPEVLAVNLTKNQAERIAKFNMSENRDNAEAVSKGWLKFEAMKG